MAPLPTAAPGKSEKRWLGLQEGEWSPSPAQCRQRLQGLRKVASLSSRQHSGCEEEEELWLKSSQWCSGNPISQKEVLLEKGRACI